MGVTYEEGEATSVTGNKLFTAKYLPSPGPPVAILMMHHGLAEHIGRYKDCARVRGPGSTCCWEVLPWPLPQPVRTVCAAGWTSLAGRGACSWEHTACLPCLGLSDELLSVRHVGVVLASACARLVTWVAAERCSGPCLGEGL